MSKDLEWGFLGKPIKKKKSNALISPRAERPKSFRYAAEGDDEFKRKLDNVAKKNSEKERELRSSTPTIYKKRIEEDSQAKSTQSSPMRMRETLTKTPPPPLILYKRKHSESKDYLIKYVSNEKKLESSKLKSSGNSILLERKRQLTIQEMVDTEKTYVEFLQTVIALFVNPVKKSLVQDAEPLLTQKGIDLIFQNIEQVCEVNMIFLKKLAKRKLTSTINWCDIFISTFSQDSIRNVYQQYVNGYTVAVEFLSNLMKGNIDYQQNKNKQLGNLPKFKEFVQKKLQNPLCLGFSSLSSYLITPVQRLPRYLLLLKEIVKYTHESHPDFQNSVTAYKILKEMTSTIENEKSHYDEILRVQLLFHKFDDSQRSKISAINDPIRKLIAEGQMMEKIEYTDSILREPLHSKSIPRANRNSVSLSNSGGNNTNTNNNNSNILLNSNHTNCNNNNTINNINDSSGITQILNSSNNASNHSHSITHDSPQKVLTGRENSVQNREKDDQPTYLLRYILLFSDMIICATKSKDSLFLEWKLDLHKCYIRFISSEDPLDEHYQLIDYHKDIKEFGSFSFPKVHNLYPATMGAFNLEFWKPHFNQLIQNYSDPMLFSASLNFITRSIASIFNSNSWDSIYDKSVTKEFLDGSSVLCIGEPSTNLCFIREGKCNVVTENDEVIGTVHQYECISEITYLTDERDKINIFNIITEDRSRVSRVVFSDLDATLLSNPYLAKLFFIYCSLVILKRYYNVFLTGKYKSQCDEIALNPAEIQSVDEAFHNKPFVPQKDLGKLKLPKAEIASLITSVNCSLVTNKKRKVPGTLYLFKNRIGFVFESKQEAKIINSHYVMKIQDIPTFGLQVNMHESGEKGIVLKMHELHFTNENDRHLLRSHLNNFISSRFSKKFFININSLNSNGIYILDGSDWKLIHRTGEELIFKPGDIVQSPSVSPDRFFRIISGSCAVECTDISCKNKIIQQLGSGEFLGEARFLIGLHPFGVVKAIDEVKVVAFDIKLLTQFLDSNDDVRVGFFKQLAQSISRKFTLLQNSVALNLPC